MSFLANPVGFCFVWQKMISKQRDELTKQGGLLIERAMLPAAVVVLCLEFVGLRTT
jgi:hypothetical protein